eukprot:CAMPEP_0179361614 /NCGR_PEP_ID=MMETSP0797-20121207/80591_1 /TAXON_ID=47934 /ORGANISM="Dinophysis acuminata, Strain DAEP01" /LENGTH=165 /DNA_ID=CAMNT_0021077021 /DNA_START=305 /DNA_END=801 /DNA_ORIENTATION=+
MAAPLHLRCVVILLLHISSCDDTGAGAAWQDDFGAKVPVTRGADAPSPRLGPHAAARCPERTSAGGRSACSGAPRTDKGGALAPHAGAAAALVNSSGGRKSAAPCGAHPASRARAGAAGARPASGPSPRNAASMSSGMAGDALRKAPGAMIGGVASSPAAAATDG